MSDRKFDIDVGKIHQPYIKKLGRRGLMKKLSAIGFSSAAAVGLTVDDVKAASKSEVPIVTGYYQEDPDDKYSDRKPHVEYVSKNWYESLQKARKVKKENQKDLIKKPNVTGVAVNPGRNGEKVKIEVGIDSNSTQSIDAKIPSRIDGVPVVETSLGRPEPMSSCDVSELDNWDSNTDFAKGGYKIRNPQTGSNGTLAIDVLNVSDLKDYGLSNHHVIATDGEVGATVEDPEGQTIGTTTEKHCKEDWAVFYGSSTMFPNEVEFSGYSGITGHFSKDGCANLASQSATCHKVGHTTCKTSFDIMNSNGFYIDYDSDCHQCPHHNLYQAQDSDFDAGDSGSLVYHESPENPDKAWAVSLASYSYPKNANITGVAAFRINDRGYFF